MFRSILVTLALCPVAAAAQCPVAADLETGIFVSYADDTSEIYRRLTEDVVMVEEAGDEPTWRNLLGRGVYLLQLASLDGGQMELEYTTNITYPVAVGDLPLPAPGAQASYLTLTNDANFANISNETQIHSYGEATTLTIGACSYGMVPMTVTYSGAGDWAASYVEEIGYLPDLGFGILLSFRDEDEDEPERFVPVSIRAVEN